MIKVHASFFSKKVNFNLLLTIRRKDLYQKEKVTIYIKAFGELALLYNAPRTGSVKAREKSYLWALDRITFSELIKKIIQKNTQENLKFLNSLEFIKDFT
jgi:cAMP-dependent protein kinase regulator